MIRVPWRVYVYNSAQTIKNRQLDQIWKITCRGSWRNEQHCRRTPKEDSKLNRKIGYRVVAEAYGTPFAKDLGVTQIIDDFVQRHVSDRSFYWVVSVRGSTAQSVNLATTCHVVKSMARDIF